MPGLFQSRFSDDQRADNLIKAHLHNNKESQNNLKTFDMRHALYLETDKNMLLKMRKRLKTQIKNLCEEFNQNNPGENLDSKYMRLTQYLCFLPIANIKPSDVYEVPEFNESTGTWVIVNYRVQPIELSPTYGFESLILADHERIFAYGLCPISPAIENFTPNKHLIFTTPKYPTNQGYFTQLFLNFCSQESLYKKFQEAIRSWFKDESNTMVHGVGYEGGIAYMTAFDEKINSKISAIFVDDAHGIRDTLSINYQRKWTDLKNKPKICIQPSKNHYNLGRMLQDRESLNEDGTSLDAEQYFYRTILVDTILKGLVNMLIVLPLRYFVIPLLRTILNHKMELALISAMIMIFNILPGLIMMPVGIAVVTLTASYLAYQLIEPIKKLINCKKDDISLADCHKPDDIEQTEINANVNLVQTN
jgi:hypothetical protein